MTAVRIEAIAFSDERFSDLARLAGLADGSHALGKMAYLWRQCTVEQTYVLPVVTITRILGEQGVDALIGARLGELADGGVRIRGTRGRVEWLGKLRNNARKGGKATRAKWQAKEEPTGLDSRRPDQGPLTPTLTTTTTLTSKNPIVPLAARRSKRKSKPNEPTETEMASVKVVLEKLGKRNGIAYRASGAHTGLIVARLRDGYTEHDLRKVIGYCSSELGWQDNPDMAKYLRPETLFGPTTIERYADAARAWFETLPEDPQP